MVRIFRAVTKTSYTYFQVAYYQNGERKRETLREEEAARRRARKVLDDLADGEVEAAGMRLEDVRAYNCARKLLESTGVSLETACREYAQAFALLGGVSVVQAARDYAARKAGVVGVRTVEQVVDEYLKAKEEGLATRIGGRFPRSAGSI